jgi:VanZ family protein
MSLFSLKQSGFFILALTIAAVILLGYSLPGENRLIYSLQDSGHFLIFTLLTLAVLWRYRKSQIWLVLLLMSLVFLFGILIEAAQSLIDRNPSLYDVLMDLLGVAAGGMVYAGFIRRTLSSGLTLVVVILLTLVAFYKPLYWLKVYQVRADEFPRLMNPESFFASGLLEAKPEGEIRHLTLPDNGSIPLESGINTCIYVSLLSGRWPGITIQEPEPNWRGYESLEVTIYSDQQDDLPLTLRINDQKHNNKYLDRYNRRLLVNPGYNRFSLPLREIEQAPKGRVMDMGNISGLKVFASKEHVGKGFCLLSMELR